jgi:hypothetical protein
MNDKQVCEKMIILQIYSYIPVCNITKNLMLFIKLENTWKVYRTYIVIICFFIYNVHCTLFFLGGIPCLDLI